MPLTDDILRRLVATPYGRSQLDLILSANPGLAPNLSQGPDPAETGVPTRPRPVLTTLPQATQATAATAGFMPQAVAPPSDVLQSAASSPMGSNFTPESLLREPEPAPEPTGGGMWDRVKDFFTPDDTEGDTSDPYDQDVSSRAWAGAAAAAAQTASDWRASPIQVLTNALAGYGGAKSRAKDELRKEAREDRLFDLKERGLTSEIEAREFEQLQAEQTLAKQQEVLAGLSPEVRAKVEPLLAFGAKEQAANIISPKPRDPIKLGQGETLLGANNEVLAAIPAKVDPLTLGEGQIAVDPLTGQIIGQGLAKTFPPQAPQAQYELEGGVRLNRFTGAIEKIPGANVGSLPSFAQLQALRDAAPPGQARDELQMQIDKLNDQSDGSGTLYTVRRPDGTTGYATRDEVTAHPEWEPLRVESTGTQPERDRQKVLEYNQVIGPDGTGFNKLTPPQQAEYRRLINEMSQPKIDPNSGFTIYPELGDLARPPPLPDADVPSVLGAVPSDVPTLAPPAGASITAAPLPPLQSGAVPADVPTTVAPAGAVAPPQPPRLERMPAGGAGFGTSKKQLEDYNEAFSARRDIGSTVGRIKKLLSQAGTVDRLSGPIAEKLRLNVNDLVTALGKKSTAGVMQVGDIKRYTDQLGDPTAVMSNISNALGFRDFGAMIDELDHSAQQGLMLRAVESGQKSTRIMIDGQEQPVPVFATDELMDKAKLSPNSLVVAPDGSLYQVGADGSLTRRD